MGLGANFYQNKSIAKFKQDIQILLIMRAIINKINYPIKLLKLVNNYNYFWICRVFVSSTLILQQTNKQVTHKWLGQMTWT